MTDSFLEAVAKGAGVADLDKWNTERPDPVVADEVTKVQDEASKLGLHATPSFLISGPRGQKVLTAPPLEQPRSAIAAVR